MLLIFLLMCREKKLLVLKHRHNPTNFSCQLIMLVITVMKRYGYSYKHIHAAISMQHKNCFRFCRLKWSMHHVYNFRYRRMLLINRWPMLHQIQFKQISPNQIIWWLYVVIWVCVIVRLTQVGINPIVQESHYFLVQYAHGG